MRITEAQQTQVDKIPERIKEIWANTKFIQVDEFGFYHYEIKCTEKKTINFSVEPSLAVIYRALIKKTEIMHVEKKRQSYVETDDYKTCFTSLLNSIKPIKVD